MPRSSSTATSSGSRCSAAPTSVPGPRAWLQLGHAQVHLGVVEEMGLRRLPAHGHARPGRRPGRHHARARGAGCRSSFHRAREDFGKTVRGLHLRSCRQRDRAHRRRSHLNHHRVRRRPLSERTLLTLFLIPVTVLAVAGSSRTRSSRPSSPTPRSWCRVTTRADRLLLVVPPSPASCSSPWR